MAKRFLFCIAGGSGHLHPLVPLARALEERGHEVAFAAGASHRPAIEAAGFEFFRVGGKMAADPEYRQVKAQQEIMGLGLDVEMFLYSRLWCGIGTRLRTPDLVELARRWQPDMLVRETGEYGAVVAAEHLGLPHATISVTASLKGFSLFERGAAEQLDPIRQYWGLAPDPEGKFIHRYLYLAYSPPTFATHDISLDVFGTGSAVTPEVEAAVPPTTHFIRPQFFDQADSGSSESLPDWVGRLLETGQPTVYVTLGTEVNKEPGVYPTVLRTITEGLRDMPVNLIVTVGRDRDPAELGPQPSNVHIERYIPQSLLLGLCVLAVMHGGSNSLLQAVDAGLPMVLVPLIADQFFNADVAHSMGLGKVMQLWEAGQPVRPEHLTTDAVRAAAQEAVGNPIYRQNVGRLRTEMRGLPEQQYAVELVERVAIEREPVLNAGTGARVRHRVVSTPGD